MTPFIILALIVGVGAWTLLWAVIIYTVLRLIDRPRYRRTQRSVNNDHRI